MTYRAFLVVGLIVCAVVAQPIQTTASQASQSPSRSAVSPAAPKPKDVVTKLTCQVVLVKREDGDQIEKLEGALFVDVREATRGSSTTLDLYGIVGSGVVRFQFPHVDDLLFGFSGPSDDFVWEMNNVLDFGAAGVRRDAVSINRVSGAIVYQEVRRTSRDPEDPADEELRVSGSCKKMDKETRKF